MPGSFLCTQLIHKGTTDRCFPKGADFPADFDVTCTANQSSNESEAIQHLEKIMFPLTEIRPLDQKTIFQFDVFEGHVTKKVASIIEENNCVIIYLSNNSTGQFQRLELNVRS